MKKRGKEQKGYRLTAGRQALLNLGYTIEQIVDQKLTIANHANIKPVQLSETAGIIEPPVQVIQQTDQEICNNQVKYFESLETTALGVALGNAKAMIISGGAGIGKSHGIEQSLSTLNGSDINHSWVTGHCTPTGLYSTLYNYRHPGCVVIFDDSDKVFYDETSLGILKHALDSKETRKISWRSKCELFDDDGNVIPPSFEFSGSIIFISNLNLSGIVSQNNKLSPHIDAIISRILYYDLHKLFSTPRDFKVRISYLKDKIFLEQKIDVDGQRLIMQFFEDNAHKMRELSLRVILKLCQVYNIHGKNDFIYNASIATLK